MLQPRKVKYRKQFRGKAKGIASSGFFLAFGEWGLKALGGGWFTAAQIEAARRAITHTTKRGGKLWVRVFPDRPITQKPAGAPMGGGKGDPAGWVAVVRPGRILFELSGVDPQTAQEALRKAASKIPFPTKIVSRGGGQ